MTLPDEEIKELHKQVFAVTPDYMAYQASSVDQFYYILMCRRLINAIYSD